MEKVQLRCEYYMTGLAISFFQIDKGVLIQFLKENRSLYDLMERKEVTNAIDLQVSEIMDFITDCCLDDELRDYVASKSLLPETYDLQYDIEFLKNVSWD